MSAEENEFEYEAKVLRCHACAAGNRHSQNFQKSGGDASGLHVAITKRG